MRPGLKNNQDFSMSNKVIKVSPSILSADFGHIADEIKRLEQAGADFIHVDIMDGHFVRNLTMGPQMVAAINRATNLPLDVHLMIYNPFDYIERFVEAGADSITIHFEATEEIDETLSYIRKCNVKAGLAFCPETSASMVVKYLNKCDMVLLMTVHPGFGGQDFIPEVLEKIKFTRDICNKLDIREGGSTPRENTVDKEKLMPFDIQVDGGINPETGRKCVEAGANILVAGSYIFKHEDMKKAIESLKNCV